MRELLAGTELPLLEIGCGEGANLLHLRRQRRAARGHGGPGSALRVGVDAFARKLAFAARAVPDARFACADAGRLPFADGTFATVLIRDVLHHLPEPRATIADACRVLRPGGAFVLVEPNARNPLIRLQMTLVPAERGAARSDEAWLRGCSPASRSRGSRCRPPHPFRSTACCCTTASGCRGWARAAPCCAPSTVWKRLAGRVIPAGALVVPDRTRAANHIGSPRRARSLPAHAAGWKWPLRYATFAPLAMRVLVVTPTYNERDNLEALCDAVLASPVGADYMIVDDNSPDGTGSARRPARGPEPAHQGHAPRRASSASAAPTAQAFTRALARRLRRGDLDGRRLVARPAVPARPWSPAPRRPTW